SWHTRVVGIIKRALHASQDGIDTILNALSQPDIAIVSITVTEKGYCYLPSTSSLDFSHPLIQHDLANPTNPQSLPGVLVEALNRRYQQNIPPFTVMSCDNMPENGHMTQNVVLALAEHRDPALALWIKKN